MALCKSCYKRNTSRDNLCQTCIDSGITLHPRFTGCTNCGNPKVMSIGKCIACYRYYNKYGVERTPGTRRQAPKPKKQCSNCGVAAAISRGRCSVCYQHFMTHKEDIDPQIARTRTPRLKRQPKNCINCGNSPALTKERCSTCYSYFTKHGIDRRTSYTARKIPQDAPKCIICSRPNVISKHRCSSCYQYYNKHGADRDQARARTLYERAFGSQRQCIVCGKDQIVSRNRCSSCYQYYNKHGADRDKTQRMIPRAMLPAQRQCTVCGRNQVASKGRCSSCYQHYNKHGTDRDPEHARKLYERSLHPNRRCSNCNKEQVVSKGRCAACYQYFRMRGKERDSANLRIRRVDRRQKEACVNGCTIEPKLWAERLWQKPYYGTKPIITTMVGREATPTESGWLCATHHARWKKYPCVKKPPPPGAKYAIRAYPRGMWICKGRTLSDPGPCPNVPLQLERFDSTGKLDYGKKEPDNMDIYLDGLCQDCRNAEQGIIYDKAVEIGHDPHPTPKIMKRALGIILRELETGTAEPADPPSDEPVESAAHEIPQLEPADEKPQNKMIVLGEWGPTLEDLQ